MLVQAGSSGTGQRFSAKYAEAVFTSHPAMESAKAFYDSLKGQLPRFGRSADSLKILPSITPVVGSTEAEAKRFQEELNELIHSDLALSTLSGFLGGFDFTGYDLDGPLPPIPETENARSTRQRVVDWAERENLTIRQIAQRVAAQRTSSNVVGGPEQVADVLEQWFRGGAADGFVIGVPVLPYSLELFTQEVIPILRKRGLFREDYEGRTLRENLGLERPVNRYVLHPERHVEPEVW